MPWTLQLIAVNLAWVETDSQVMTSGFCLGDLMGIWSTFYILHITVWCDCGPASNFLVLIWIREWFFFFYKRFITESLLIKVQIHCKVDDQTLQNRTTLGDFIVISIVSITLKVQNILTVVLEGLGWYFLFNFFCGSGFGITYFWNGVAVKNPVFSCVCIVQGPSIEMQELSLHKMDS